MSQKINLNETLAHCKIEAFKLLQQLACSRNMVSATNLSKEGWNKPSNLS